MDRPDLFDNAQWEALLMGKAEELGDDPAACEQLVYRFLGQYLPPCFPQGTRKAAIAYGGPCGST